MIGAWVTTGLCLVLFMAGVQRIPLSRYEAARVDGAGPVHEFFAVTLPGLRNELAVAMSLTVITALRAFDIIFVTTKGGPGSQTTVPSLLIYQRAFVTGQVGSAAAIGAIMAVIILVLAVVITRVVEEHGEDQRLRANAHLRRAGVVRADGDLPAGRGGVGRDAPVRHSAGRCQPAPHAQPVATFRDAWTQGHFGQLMRSSVMVAITVVVLTTAASIPAGYRVRDDAVPVSNLCFYVLLTGIVVPFEALIVPLYYGFRDHGLTNSYWGLILPQTALSISFGTFWMRAFFRSVPPELADAARVDGASSWRILWRVLVPIGRPAILTMVLLVFMWTWNEFLLPLVMISDELHRTAPLGLSAFQSRYGVDIPGVSAAAVLVAAPVVILYIVLQRQFLRGMLAGSIKG